MYTEWAPANTPFGAMSIALGLRAEEDEQVLEQRRGLLISLLDTRLWTASALTLRIARSHWLTWNDCAP